MSSQVGHSIAYGSPSVALGVGEVGQEHEVYGQPLRVRPGRIVTQQAAMNAHPTRVDRQRLGAQTLHAVGGGEYVPRRDEHRPTAV